MNNSGPTYPKRLIEVDLPIAQISKYARAEKDSRLGHIPRLHIYPAARPLASSRAILCASLWPDPVDRLCTPQFREEAYRILESLQKQVNEAGLSHDQRSATEPVSRIRLPKDRTDTLGLRQALLDFIAEFSNWDLCSNRFFLETSRSLTQSAHIALGGLHGTRPLVVDPFAGGGSIPLEALRIGADTYASDLNPVAVLINKVILEYVPRYGTRLVEEIKKWGSYITEHSTERLGSFFPADPDGSIPMAYLWARTVISEAPSENSEIDIPVEIPLIKTFWVARKGDKRKALRWVRNNLSEIQCEIVSVTYADGVTRTVRRPMLEIYEPKDHSDIQPGTVARGSATCPITGFTTPATSVRKQLKARSGGSRDARLFCIVTISPTEQGRSYRVPTSRDWEITERAAKELERRHHDHIGRFPLIPDEPTPPGGGRGAGRAFSQRQYGMNAFADLFTPRQLLALTTYCDLAIEYCEILRKSGDPLHEALSTVLALVVDRLADLNASLCVWQLSTPNTAHVFGRWAIQIVMDFGEVNPLAKAGGSPESALRRLVACIEELVLAHYSSGSVVNSDAALHPLPDDSVQAFVTDPPYYDAVPYSDLLDFFYVWLRRSLGDTHLQLFTESSGPKSPECIVDEVKGKDHAYFENTIRQCFKEGRRITTPEGIAVIVFAHKSTSGWESLLQAIVDSGWIVTGSWPIDTEMGSRLRAKNSAALASSVHIVCRPREHSDGSLRDSEVGDWRDILEELPRRIHDWMPRLASEGVVGADAIFACLGPALEVFSCYSRVEKSNGDVVPLREYLEHVWAAVSHEALTMIFKDADAAGLEPDARLTAMWLWTLGASPASGNGDGNSDTDETEGDDDDNEDENKGAKASGFVLEFDAARKIAQGLGIHLEKSPSVVEVKGDKARLLPVAERTRYLFGKDSAEPAASKKKPKKKDTQLSFFAVLEEVDAAESVEKPELKSPPPGTTVLDRVHQAMILFAAGRGEALKRFLVEEGAGKDGRFWKLAQSLSALYPTGIDEKRWVDGVLARKKSLGL